MDLKFYIYMFLLVKRYTCTLSLISYIEFEIQNLNFENFLNNPKSYK